MAAADQRIVIRNESTGEMQHGIAGHVPDGWLAVKAARSDTLAHRSLASTEANDASRQDTIRPVQNVRSKEGSHVGWRISARTKP